MLSRKAAVAALAALILAGCSPAYVYKAWRGHSRLLAKQRPVIEVLSDPAASPELKSRLGLVGEIRAFAFERMGLAYSRNYTALVEIKDAHVTHAVTAAEKTRFKAYEWWFPVVGRVPYKGYFDRAEAQREEQRLQKRGYDTYLAGVSAYSTLGWTSDPLLSTMLDDPPGALAQLILHELTHSSVFFKGQADFNEALASFVGEEGARDFLRGRFGEDSPEWLEHERRAQNEASFDLRMDKLRQDLEALYAADLPQEDKLTRRQALFEAARGELGLGPEEPLNNAVVLAHARYRHNLEDFREAHERLGWDWRKTMELFKTLDRWRPRQALRSWLERPS